METIKNPQTCLVKKHVAGDTVTMVVIVSDVMQKLYHFEVYDEDTTVQDLLEQITDSARPPMKVHLLTDPNSKYNYIVETEKEVEKNSGQKNDKRRVVESPVKTYNSSGSASARISSRPERPQNEAEEFEDRNNLTLSPLPDFWNKSEAEIDKKEEAIAAETNEKEELLEDDFMVDNVRPPYTHLYCRVISIGTHYYVPKESVIMAASGAHFRVPHPRDDSNLVLVLLKSKAILKVAYNFRESLPALFFFVEWHASLEISSLLGMQKGNGPYYDSLAKDRRTSLIAFVLESLSEESRNFLEILFSQPNDLMIPMEEDDVENTLRHILTRRVWLNIKGLVSSSKEATSTNCNSVNHKLEPPVIKPQSSTELSEESTFKNRVGTGTIVETPEAPITALEKRKETANNAGKLQTSVKETEMFKEPVAAAENSINQNAEILLVYPPSPARGRITLSLRDYDSLREDRFLNDVIIDFYLKYLTHQVLSKEDQDRTHVFSVHFYNRLTSSDPPPIKNDSFLSLARRRHANVKKWTKNMNIFEKDFVVVPINECAHWYLAIICYPGLVAKAYGSPELERRPRKAKEARREVVGTTNEKGIKNLPCILIFDSLNGSTKNGREAMATLRDYLSCEHEAKSGTEIDFTEVTMKGDCPKVPQQSNYSDCGLYLLQYVEHFFKNPIRDYTLPLKTLEHWFDADVVNGKRKQISKLIRKLSKRQ